MPTDDEIRARRERKAEEYKQRTAPERRKGSMKVVLLSVAGVLAVAAIVAGYIALQPEEDVHIHSAIHAYVNGERVDLSNPALDMRNTGYMRGHLHNVGGGSTSVVHVEGTPGLTIGDFFKRGLLGSIVATDYIDLNENLGPANRTGRTDAPSQLWTKLDDGEWIKRGGNPADYEWVDRELVLLVYGTPTDEELDTMKLGLERDPFRV